MSLPCRIARAQMVTGDMSRVAGPLRRHVGACLGCQAESVRYRRLSRALASLATEIVVAPPGLVGGIQARIAVDSTVPRPTGGARPARVAAAAGAAVAAAGTVAVVRWLRTRAAA